MVLRSSSPRRGGVAPTSRARARDAGRSLLLGARDTAVGLWLDARQGLTQLGRGIGALLRGDLPGGARRLGRGLVGLVVQVPLDALLLLGGKVVSALQTLAGLEAVGRPLAPAELAVLRTVFGDSVAWARVRIKAGDAGLWSVNARPFVHGDTIYVKHRPLTGELLVHEAAHVWQHQHGGPRYMTEALASQGWGLGYDWRASVPGAPWAELEPEQQAELLGDAWAHGAFAGPARRFVVDGVDYTEYLGRALEEVRAGRGA